MPFLVTLKTHKGSYSQVVYADNGTDAIEVMSSGFDSPEESATSAIFIGDL